MVNNKFEMKKKKKKGIAQVKLQDFVHVLFYNKLYRQYDIFLAYVYRLLIYSMIFLVVLDCFLDLTIEHFLAIGRVEEVSNQHSQVKCAFVHAIDVNTFMILLLIDVFLQFAFLQALQAMLPQFPYFVAELKLNYPCRA